MLWRGDQEFQILVVGLLADDSGEVLKYVIEAKLCLFHLQLASLDLREVEDVVDDAEEGLCSHLCLCQIVALLRGQIGLQGQMGHSEDRIHGGADLMAHVGEEVGLGLGGGHGFFFGSDEICFGLLAIGDVFGRVEEILRIPGSVSD